MTSHEKLLSLCRAVMPGIAGVVLATSAGRLVAHERGLATQPTALAREAARTRALDTSALVARPEGLYLVVFVPASEQARASLAAPALPA